MTTTKNKKIKVVEETVIPSQEERILGKQETIKVVKVVDYTAQDVRYKVENVKKQRTYELNGYEIGAILGCNEDVKTKLKAGEKKVTISNFKGDEILYNIEVL